MPNKGIKASMNLPVTRGRPAGKYANPYGVPASQYYKILRQKAMNNKIAIQQQQNVDIRKQIIAQNTPQAFDRRIASSSEGWMGDIDNSGAFNY